MSSRFRDRRQRGTRSAGILRRNQPTARTTEVQHSLPTQGFNQWRLVSLAMIAVLVGVLIMFFSVDAFYIRSVSVSELNYLTKEEVFAFTDIANMHVFWVNREQVRDNLLRSPSIADADVLITWPPDMIRITIEEREPQLVWEQGGTAVWVDLQGRVMAQREDQADLVRVIAESGSFGDSFDIEGQLSPDVVNGALQMQDLLQVNILRYHETKGLGIKNTNGWDVWFGIGTQMPEKVLIYNSILVSLQARGIQPGEVNIVNPDAPFYTVLWGREG